MSTVKIRIFQSSGTQQGMSHMAGVGGEEGDGHVCVQGVF